MRALKRFDLKGLGPLRAELRFTLDRQGLLRLEGRLMAEVVRLVEEIHGVRLEPETVLVGF